MSHAARRPGLLLVSPSAYAAVLAVALALIAYRLIHEFQTHDVRYLYMEYLATYRDFGFIRRGLVPQLLSYPFPHLTHLHVRIFSVAIVCAALAGYVATYARCFGVTARELPLLAFTIASPAVFKNFAFDFSRLDVFGFFAGLVALALPVSGAYPFFIGGACCIAILIHEVQAITYVPAVFCVAALRVAAASPSLRRRDVATAAIVAIAIAITFALTVAYGTPDVPPDEMLARLRGLAVDPFFDRVFLWYVGPVQHMAAASDPALLRKQLVRLPSYALILGVHLPLFAYALRIAHPARASLRWIAGIGSTAVTAGLLALLVTSPDRARFTADWLTCLILILHALCLVHPPGERERGTLLTRSALAAAWLAALVPRLGLMTPPG